MNDILIKGEKILIKGLRYSKFVVIGEELKKELRYQKLFLVKGIKYKVIDLSGFCGKIAVPGDYEKAYVVVNIKSETTKKVKYKEDDIKVIKCFIHHFSGIKPEITEKLCKAIGYNILSDYHKVFGLKKLSCFKDSLFKKTPIKIGQPDSLYYGRPRYSVISLVSDLVKAKDVQIFTDPELIDKYKRISTSTESGSITRDSWAKLSGFSGNRTRANISLKTISKVQVMIPENEVGVDSGERTLTSIRSFAVIVDGELNMKEIGIKTSDTKLIGKLKRLGILESMTFESEYVISLSKLPLFSKRPPISSHQLGNAEYVVRETEIKSRYISLLIYRQEKKLVNLPRKLDVPEDKSESVLFLESLGIYGDLYYPRRISSGWSYKATEVIGKVKGIPEDPYPNIRDFINSGTCKNAVINKALKDLAVYREETDLEKLRLVLEKVEEKKKEWVNYLRSLKFRIISGKTLMISGKQLEDTIVNLGDVLVSWVVKDTEIKI